MFRLSWYVTVSHVVRGRSWLLVLCSCCCIGECVCTYQGQNGRKQLIGIRMRHKMAEHGRQTVSYGVYSGIPRTIPIDIELINQVPPPNSQYATKITTIITTTAIGK